MLGCGCFGSAKGRSSTALSAIESAQATSTTLPTKENTHIRKSELSAAYSSVFFPEHIFHEHNCAFRLPHDIVEGNEYLWSAGVPSHKT
jgi:hypothetical protein